VPTRESTGPSMRLAAALLGLLILMGSLLLVAIPLGWLWLLSQLGQPYLAVYFLALVGCPVMMIAWGVALVRLNRIYARISADGEQAIQMLEVSVAISVIIAVLLLVAWLLLYPHGGGPVEGPWPG
jgi:predicted signal transduction protein with EAL and GGDEF domain